jgi:hypothetical protein
MLVGGLASKGHLGLPPNYLDLLDSFELIPATSIGTDGNGLKSYYSFEPFRTGDRKCIPMTALNNSKRLVTIAHILAWCSLGTWLFCIYLFLQYDATRPTVPQPIEDRIYASNNHGHVVYLNSKEQDDLYYLGSGAFLLFGIAALLGYQASHPKRLREIHHELLAFARSLFTTAGWSAIGRTVRYERTSIAESIRDIFTRPDKIGLHSDKSIDNCRTELQKMVYLNAMNISGDVDKDRIHLFMVHKDLTNSFSPHFYGKLRVSPSGTMINGRFTIARFVMAFLGVWFGVIGVVMFMVTPSSIGALVTGRSPVLNPVLGAFFPPFLLACGLFMLHWGYQLGRNDKAHIVNFLQHTLNARHVNQ